MQPFGKTTLLDEFRGLGCDLALKERTSDTDQDQRSIRGEFRVGGRNGLYGL